MWFWLIILLGLFAIVVRRACRFTRLAYRINQTPICAIGQLVNGFTVVEGNAVALDSLLIAPLTREPCIAFGVRVAVPGEDADLAMSSGRIKFAIDDGTGRIELNPSEWSFEDVGDTFNHEEGSTPPPELLERVRLLFPYIEDRSADGDLKDVLLRNHCQGRHNFVCGRPCCCHQCQEGV